MAITDWYNNVNLLCDEDLACWTGKIHELEEEGLMYSKTTLEPTNVEGSLQYCMNLLDTYQEPVED